MLILINIAFYTWFERKLLGFIQRRTGPNIVGYIGLLQAIADAVKALAKPITLPIKSETLIFRYAPMFGLILIGSLWGFINIFYSFSRPYLNILLFFAISTLGVYSIIFTAWAGNSFYSILGGIRAAAQMLSYDVVLSLCLIPILVLTASLDLYEITTLTTTITYIKKILPILIIFFIILLAEANRTPFDLPEAEAELVAGYHVEHSGFLFAIFFLAEYSAMLLSGCLCSLII